MRRIVRREIHGRGVKTLDQQANRVLKTRIDGPAKRVNIPRRTSCGRAPNRAAATVLVVDRLEEAKEPHRLLMILIVSSVQHCGDPPTNLTRASCHERLGLSGAVEGMRCKSNEFPLDASNRRNPVGIAPIEVPGKGMKLLLLLTVYNRCDENGGHTTASPCLSIRGVALDPGLAKPEPPSEQAGRSESTKPCRHRRFRTSTVTSMLPRIAIFCPENVTFFLSFHIFLCVFGDAWHRFYALRSRCIIEA